MAKKRVIAYVMHEHELAEANAAIPGGESTDAFVVGEVDDSVILQLREKGIVVQTIEDDARPALRTTGEQMPAATPRAFRRGLTPAPAAAGVTSDYYELALSGPLLDSFRGALEQQGAQIREALPGYRLRAKVMPADLAAVQALPFVLSLKMEDSETALPTALEFAAVPAGGRSN